MTGGPSVPTDGRTVTVRVPMASASAAGGSWSLRPTAPIDRRAGPPAYRQRHGQGDRAGVPVAGDAGDGTYATIREIAAAEKINESYVGRVLRLTLLAPDIVEAILDGRSRRR